MFGSGIRFAWVGLLAAASLGLGGCLVRGGYDAEYTEPAATGYVVYQAPPPRRVVVVRPAAPYAGAVWVQGHWNWNGSQWVWQQGSWIQPRVGYFWVQPRWERRGRGWVYVRGGWQGGGRGRVVVRSRPVRPRVRPRVRVEVRGRRPPPRANGRVRVEVR